MEASGRLMAAEKAAADMVAADMVAAVSTVEAKAAVMVAALVATVEAMGVQAEAEAMGVAIREGWGKCARWRSKRASRIQIHQRDLGARTRRGAQSRYRALLPEERQTVDPLAASWCTHSMRHY